MRNSSRFFIGCSLLVVLACYGCSYKIPETEMKAAQEAMDQAKGVHAEDLASAEWKDAMETWEQAQAAIKDSKPAKTLLLRAKSRFEKAVKIAKANGDGVAKEITGIQLAISERYSKVKAAVEKGGLVAKVKKEIAAIAAEVDEGTSSIDNLVSQGELLKARALAKEIQQKVYNAELILAGKKPAP